LRIIAFAFVPLDLPSRAARSTMYKCP